MPFDAHKNFAISTVATAPSPATSGLSLVVASGEGARFPAVPFNATVWPANAVPTPANSEIVRVTSRSTDTLTITRAQETGTGGPSARTIVVGDQIAATITAKTITDIESGVNFPLITSLGLIDIAAAGAGQIKFPATQNGSSDANTLDDYEEGTWTPTDASGASLSFTGVSAAYIKIGQLVVAGFELVYPATANGSAARIGGLPFSASGTPTNGWAGVNGYTNSNVGFGYLVSGTAMFPYKIDGSQPTNANLNNANVRGVGLYRASA